MWKKKKNAAKPAPTISKSKKSAQETESTEDPLTELIATVGRSTQMGEYVTHEVKLGIHFCDPVYSGKKPFEVRRNDRGYQTGDHLRFIPFAYGEQDREKLFPDHPIKYVEYEITYMINGWGIENGYVVLGIRPVGGGTDG